MIFQSTDNTRIGKPVGTTICLCMIVKDESRVIQRCLASVKPLIDNWLIVDTGSTDDTVEVIRKVMSPLPGRIEERPWVDFGHNRSEAMALAQEMSDFTLTIDADEILLLDDDFAWPDFLNDIYAIKTRLGPLVFARGYLMRSTLGWRYEGVIHERPACDSATSINWLEKATVFSLGDGGRSQITDRNEQEVRDLKAALAKNPQNDRYRFLLANALTNTSKLHEALEVYEQCLKIDKTPYHRWYATYQIALVNERLGGQNAEIVGQYQKAFELDPRRAEPLYRLVRLHRLAGEFGVARQLAEVALTIEKPEVFEPVDHELYDILLPAEYAICCQQLGDRQTATTIYNKLLKKPGLTAQVKVMLENNKRLAST